MLQETGWKATQLAHDVSVVASEHGHEMIVNRSTAMRRLSGTHPRPSAPAYILEALSRRLGGAPTPPV